MEAITMLQVFGSVLGALGGFEFIRWFCNRKTNSRIAIAEAESAEFKTLQETNEFLQKQLHLKEERFVEQTNRLRSTQDELFKAKEQEYEARLELALKKCEDQDCPFRRPPNAQTPPKPGATKEQFHNQRLLPV